MCDAMGDRSVAQACCSRRSLGPVISSRIRISGGIDNARGEQCFPSAEEWTKGWVAYVDPYKYL